MWGHVQVNVYKYVAKQMIVHSSRPLDAQGGRRTLSILEIWKGGSETTKCLSSSQLLPLANLRVYYQTKQTRAKSQTSTQVKDKVEDTGTEKDTEAQALSLTHTQAQTQLQK